MVVLFDPLTDGGLFLLEPKIPNKSFACDVNEFVLGASQAGKTSNVRKINLLNAKLIIAPPLKKFPKPLTR